MSGEIIDQTAYDEGREACRRRHGRNSNPYPFNGAKNSPHQKGWFLGYDDALAENRRLAKRS